VAGRAVVEGSSGGAGVVICLERGADVHMAQRMPLPLTVSCFSKIQIGFPFWHRLTWVVPEKGRYTGVVVVVSWTDRFESSLVWRQILATYLVHEVGRPEGDHEAHSVDDSAGADGWEQIRRGSIQPRQQQLDVQHPAAYVIHLPSAITRE